MAASILKPGHNCWRLEQTHRAAFLIDGEAYYRAFRSAVEQAKHSILILGWDINSQLRLVRDAASKTQSEELADFLDAVISRQQQLQVHILLWDFAMIYALEREWLPIYRLGWQTHRQLHFEMDDQHPIGASHHQKVVVVDDKVAFAGGFDLSKWRWDTPEHRPNDPRRTEPDGTHYPPFHDVQMLVDGPAAAALGDLARERWYRTTGHRLSPPNNSRYQGDPWPMEVSPDLEQVTLAIARTEPQFKQYREVREVEQLYLDAIAAAQRSIYIENQYFTSHRIAAALAARLQEANGPEVILVLPFRTGGWLEQNTMDVLREHSLKRLREADKHNRLRVYYPHIPGLNKQYIMVHAKVLVVDNRLVRIGSSNLSNRSMGLDTECDLAVEAKASDATAEAIAHFRNRLLSEHLGVKAVQVAQAIAQQGGSLIAAVEKLRNSGRTLKELTTSVSSKAGLLLSDTAIIDPESAINPDRLAQELIPREQRQSASRQLIFRAFLFAIPAFLAAAWHWTPWGDWLDLQTLISTINRLQEYTGAPFLVLGTYLIAGLIAVPITLLIIATVLIFGSLTGFIYGLIGATFSAMLTYGLGRLLGRRTVRRFAGSRINQLSRRLAQRGILTVFAVRLLPVAPFTVVNMVAGASYICFRDFVLGTVLGMAPGILGIALFIDRVIATVYDPTPLTFGVLGAVLGIIGLGILGLQRWLRKHGTSDSDKVLDHA
jgi:phospholipase D1/2